MQPIKTSSRKHYSFELLIASKKEEINALREEINTIKISGVTPSFNEYGGIALAVMAQQHSDLKTKTSRKNGRSTSC